MQKITARKIVFGIIILAVIVLIVYLSVALYGARNIHEESSPLSDNTITAADISPYLTGIVRVTCKNSDDWYGGSGSLWNLPKLGYTVLTNEHSISDDGRNSKNEGVDGGFDTQGNPLPLIKNACVVNLSGNSDDFYYVNLGEKYQWNAQADAADLPLHLNVGAYNSIAQYSSQDQQMLRPYARPVNTLNYSISSLRLCPSTMPVGSPVATIGYPEFGSVETSTPTSATTTQIYQIMETGIISGIITNDIHSGAVLTYPDYFTSAKSDSGDSGGIAFSKDSNGLCILGVPTWVNHGQYESEGQIQNIWDIFLQK
jgi:hypothetical protein